MAELPEKSFRILNMQRQSPWSSASTKVSSLAAAVLVCHPVAHLRDARWAEVDTDTDFFAAGHILLRHGLRNRYMSFTHRRRSNMFPGLKSRRGLSIPSGMSTEGSHGYMRRILLLPKGRC